MIKDKTLKQDDDSVLRKTNVVRSFVNIRLNRKDVEDMISTYEFLAWLNEALPRCFSNNKYKKWRFSR